MNDYLVTYIEKDVVASVDNEALMQRFKYMKICWGQLQEFIYLDFLFGLRTISNNVLKFMFKFIYF